MGQSVAVAVTNNYGVVDDEALTRYVTLVGLTVAYATPRADEEFVFGVLDSDEVNAFSGPAGYILVTRGAIQQCQDESELAGILAHEIAHVVQQHGLEAVKHARRVQGATEVLQTEETFRRFGAAADQLIDVTLNKGYSRGQEEDADEAAVRYLIAAGYDPAGYQRYLQRMASGTSSGGLQQLMSTHPGLGDRAAKVSNQIRKAGNPAGATLATRFRQHVAQPAG